MSFRHEDDPPLSLMEVAEVASEIGDPAQLLGNIVWLIGNRFQTDVCSIYLLEADRSNVVLAATVGLRHDGIGKVRMALDEGLTGLVAEQLSPVMVAEASLHPRFKYFPEAGEDLFHSFLGIPLIDCGLLQGVLVVQTIERRLFSKVEIEMLEQVAQQVAPLVTEARSLDQFAGAARA